MTKLHYLGKSGDQDVYVFHCPGCGYSHPYHVPRWTWNGSLDKPTFTPSLLCNSHSDKDRCHLFLKDGKIEYCNDCHHELKGQTIDMVEFEE